MFQLRKKPAPPAEPTPPGPLPLSFAGVSKSFGFHRVLDAVDFAPPPGSVVGLLGANGAGKSTLLKLLVGLLRADTGVVSVAGADSWDLPAAVKARIGYVDQRPRMYPWMKPKHLLPYFGSFYPRWDVGLLDRLAGEWAVPMNQAFGKLSPGQQQKVALLVAVGHHPDLLVLDEPVSALDPAARRAFLKSLLEMTADADGDGSTPTVLLSTHITSDVERVASHVAVLSDRRVGTFEELGDLKDRVKRLRIRSDGPLPEGFAVPGARTLTLDADRRGAVAVVEGDPPPLPGLDAAVEGLNLEEIFLALTEGARRDA